MQCEICSTAANVQVTDIIAGRPADHWFCGRHAPFETDLGPGRANWDHLFDWLLPRIKTLGRMPEISEFSGQGETGVWVAEAIKHPDDKFRARLQSEVSRRLASQDPASIDMSVAWKLRRM